MRNLSRIALSLLVAGLTLPAFAACDSESFFLSVGETFQFGTVMVIRLDNADFKNKGPDIYYLSVKNTRTGWTSKGLKLQQHQSIKLYNSDCGDVTLGTQGLRGESGAIKFELGFF